MKMKAILSLVAVSAALLVSASAAKRYPLDVCLVTNEKLGSMGKIIVKIYDGQEIKFCCKSCVGKFEKDRTKYLAKLP